MISHFFNIITRRLYHFNRCVQFRMDNIEEACRELPTETKAFIEGFAGGSYLMVWSMAGCKSDRVFNIPIKSISEAQYHQLIHLNMWALCALCVKQNPNYYDSAYEACLNMIDMNEYDRAVFDVIITMDDLDLAKIADTIYTQCASILDYNDGDVLDFLSLTVEFTHAYKCTMHYCKKVMNKPGP